MLLQQSPDQKSKQAICKLQEREKTKAFLSFTSPRFGYIFLACFLLTCLSSSRSYAQNTLSLALDWFINHNHGPIVIAQKQNYFSEENLKVKIITPADPTAPPRMVATGLADLAISYQPQHHLQVAAGLPLTRVGTLLSSPLNCLLVRADVGIQRIADLKGKKVGFSVPAVDKVLLAAILSHHAVPLESVTLVNVSWSLTSALMAGQVDAIIGAFRNFEIHQIQAEGMEGHCFRIEENGVPEYDELIYIAHRDNLNREAIRKFLLATAKGAEFITKHPQKSWKIFREYTTVLEEELSKLAWRDSIPHFARDPFALDQARYSQFEAFLYKMDMIETVTPVSGLAIELMP